MFMGTKTITIMDDAYNLLKSRKLKNESFSEVLRRELKKSKKPLTDFAGAWNFLSEKDIEEIKEAIRKSREDSWRFRREKLRI